jgi:hypothetical protein
VIIDRSHRTWVGICVLILVVATAAYVPYHLWSLNGPSGGSWVGLIYGFVGYGLMLYAGALGARARRPTWRLGRAETWLRGHIWLGLLAYPLILYHGGFRWGGPMTYVLMVLFTIVVVSGILGVLLQNILPRVLMDRVPLETIFEQVDRVLEQLRAEADAVVTAVFDPEQAAEAAGAAAAPGSRAAPSVRRARLGAAPVMTAAPAPEARALKEFYDREVRPYLHDETGRAAALASPSKAAVVFAQLRTRVSRELHPVVDDLEAICDERRQLRLQIRVHHWLHAWLLVHVPLSVGLLVLSAVHAVIAFRYSDVARRHRRLQE